MHFYLVKRLLSSHIEHPSKKFIDALKTSNLCQQSSAPLDILASEIRGVYLGIDPTAPYLHVGHLPALLTLARASNAGIPSFAVLGGSTAMVGDPSFKITSRPVLSEELAKNNLASIQTQLGNVFSKICPLNCPIILDNSSWLSQLGLIGFLNDFGRHVKISDLLTRERFCFWGY